MVKYLLTVVVAVALALSIAGGGIRRSEYRERRARAREMNVSLVRLLANPEKYDGKEVQVTGVARLEFEGHALYLTKEHYENWITKNALWIDLGYGDLRAKAKELAAYNGQYVIIRGVFDKDVTGHMGLFSGAIVDISRYERKWTQIRPPIQKTTPQEDAP